MIVGVVDLLLQSSRVVGGVAVVCATAVVGRLVGRTSSGTSRLWDVSWWAFWLEPLVWALWL
jgi:hypothetical protein